MKWNEKGYGRSKGIAGILIASCTFDNILCLILFGICKNVAMDIISKSKGVTQSESSFAWSIASVFVENIAGIIAGVFMGFLSWFFKFIESWKYIINLKCAYCLSVAVAFVIAGEESTFHNAKYIACLSFGYVCNRMWGDAKPAKQIADCWFFIQPFLFGTIGAALVFAQLNSGDVGRSFVCIFLGQFMRFIAVFLTSFGPKYTIKERIFMSLAWIPKSTVPATLASIVYTEANSRGSTWSDIQTFGLNIQTTTILSIMVCEPIGSWVIDQFAPKLLSIDLDDLTAKQQAIEVAKKDSDEEIQ